MYRGRRYENNDIFLQNMCILYALSNRPVIINSTGLGSVALAGNGLYSMSICSEVTLCPGYE